jgi:hypothetical protein
MPFIFAPCHLRAETPHLAQQADIIPFGFRCIANAFGIVSARTMI